MRETENRSRVEQENVKPSSHQGQPPRNKRQRLKKSETFSFLVLHVLLYSHNFNMVNMRLNFFFPFQSNYVQMVKLKIEASVQKHFKNKSGREDWILFRRLCLGILKITCCPSMFTYFLFKKVPWLSTIWCRHDSKSQMRVARHVGYMAR